MTPLTSSLLDRIRSVHHRAIGMTLTDTLEMESFIHVLRLHESEGLEIDWDMEAYVMHRVDTIEARS